MTSTNIPNGNYMKINDVIEWVERHTMRKDTKLSLPIYENEYFDTTDLKSVFPKGMFIEMECDVRTLMVGVK